MHEINIYVDFMHLCLPRLRPDFPMKARYSYGGLGPVCDRAITGHALEGSKLLVIIKQGGRKVGGAYTGGSAPAAGFKAATRIWSGPNAASLLGSAGTLPPGDYELSVQVYGPVGGKSAPISDAVTKAFTIKGVRAEHAR